MIRVRIELSEGGIILRDIPGDDMDAEVYEIAMELTGQGPIDTWRVCDTAEYWPGRANKADKTEGRAVLQKIDGRINKTEQELEDLQTERREIINFYGLNK